MLLAVAGPGCGDDVGMTLDAESDGALPDAAPDTRLPSPAPPAPVTPPELTPCPTGWTERELEGVTVCEPWPGDDPGCSGDEVRFVGAPECAPLGGSCPGDGWPTGLPAGEPTIYVAEGATLGDGSIAAPFGSIEEATAVASSGAIIAVARGTYAEVVELPPGVTLVGACPAETIVDAPAGGGGDAALWLGEGAEARRLTVRGGRPGVRPRAGATATIEELRINATLFGLVATEGARLVGRDVLIADTTPEDDIGQAAFVLNDGGIELYRASIRGMTQMAMGASGADADIVLEDVSIADTRPTSEDGLGNALAIGNGASATVRRTILSQAYSAGVMVQSGGSLSLEDVVVVDIAETPATREAGFGVGVLRSELDVRRLRIQRATSSAVSIIGFDTVAEVEDLVVASTRANTNDQHIGYGFGVEFGPSVSLSRALILDSQVVGLTVNGDEARATLEDVSIRGVAPAPFAGRVAGGLDVEARATVDASRIAVSEIAGVGVLVDGFDTTLTIQDLEVTAIGVSIGDLGGRGLAIQHDASLMASRMVVDDAIEAGILMQGGAGVRSLADIEIRDVAMSALNGAAMGVVSIEEATATLERFVVADNALAGVQIVGGGRVLARQGVITGHPVGINVQGGSVDPEDFSDAVYLIDNAANFDGSSLPVPEVASAPSP